MGTRSLTHVKDYDGTTLLTIYRQHDGYPTVMGAELKEFVEPIKIVNGIPFDLEGPLANGMGCSPAQIIAKLKDGVGSIYVYPADASGCGEDYVYTLRPNAERPDGGRSRDGRKQWHSVYLTCAYAHEARPLFDGPIADFDPDAAEADDDEEEA